MNLGDSVLCTISSGPHPPLVDVHPDPNGCVLAWLWGEGPNPYVWRGGTETWTLAPPFPCRLIRVNEPVRIYDSTEAP